MYVLVLLIDVFPAMTEISSLDLVCDLDYSALSSLSSWVMFVGYWYSEVREMKKNVTQVAAFVKHVTSRVLLQGLAPAESCPLALKWEWRGLNSRLLLETAYQSSMSKRL